MEKLKDCPKRWLVNPPSAERCNCGYDFVTRTVEDSYLGKRGPHADDITLTETALVLFVPGLGVLAGLFARSQGRRHAGNKMIIAFAAMIVLPVVSAAAFVGCQ